MNEDDEYEMLEALGRSEAEHAEERAELLAENERLKDAIRWALGETDFRGRMEGEKGAFYWRKELRERSGLDWESSPNHPANQPAVQPSAGNE